MSSQLEWWDDDEDDDLKLMCLNWSEKSSASIASGKGWKWWMKENWSLKVSQWMVHWFRPSYSHFHPCFRVYLPYHFKSRPMERWHNSLFAIYEEAKRWIAWGNPINSPHCHNLINYVLCYSNLAYTNKQHALTLPIFALQRENEFQKPQQISFNTINSIRNNKIFCYV